MRIRAVAGLFGTVVAAVAVLAFASAPAMAAPFNIYTGAHFQQPPTPGQCIAVQGVSCYGPPAFERAYEMKGLYAKGLTGAGKTIVIVDSFGSPTIETDLKAFDAEYSLPAPPSFKVIRPEGPIPPYDAGKNHNFGWAIETSLDVEYAHSMAPGANILLVETPVDETLGVQGFPQMMDAENYVINHNLGDVITQSFGAGEPTFPSASSILGLRSAFKNALKHHVTVLAAAGDDGTTDWSNVSETRVFPFRINSWPSADPLVTSVGGTQLHLNEFGARTEQDNVWNDTALLGSPAAGGGGLSAVFSRPDYQNSVDKVVGGHRGTPDVSLSAAVNGGALVQMSFPGLPGAGLYIIGGTSEASPLFSGVVAVADQAAGHRLGLLNPALYKLGDKSGSPIIDITRGNNTVTNDADGQDVTVPGFDAKPGYDLASGLGTVSGGKLVAALAK